MDRGSIQNSCPMFLSVFGRRTAPLQENIVAWGWDSQLSDIWWNYMAAQYALSVKGQVAAPLSPSNFPSLMPPLNWSSINRFQKAMPLLKLISCRVCE